MVAFQGRPTGSTGVSHCCKYQKLVQGLMARNTSISLGDYYSAFLDQQVASGRYQSASEVIRTGLRLLEEREAQLARLRAALDQGEASGPPEPFDLDAFLVEMNRS
jgi:antitoxin ParD1/3/4